MSPTDAAADADTSFTFTPPSSRHSSSDSSQDYILNISKYISVGCLRLQRSQCGIPYDTWKSCDSWAAFAHPLDIFNTEGGRYLPNKLQVQMFNLSILKPYRDLHDSGWIRMEFKSNDPNTGQARIYVLPDDVGQCTINRRVRPLRRQMQQLLSQLDISRATWRGYWEDNSRVTHITSSPDTHGNTNTSLFEIFNTLPSPSPNPEVVADKYARYAMYDILDSNIKGLTSTLYMYQRRSAAMMLQREAQTSQLLDPTLREMIDQNGNVFYCDPQAGTSLREPRYYDSDKGGILAENMGLGKTLISLALILATKGMAPQIPIEYSVGTAPVRKTTGSLLDMAAACVCRTGTPWMYSFNRNFAQEYELSNCAKAIRRNRAFYNLSPRVRREQSRITTPKERKVLLTDATIVVVPANLVQQWIQEINKHTEGLKVLNLSSSKDQLPPAEEMAEYDIILFSRQRFDKESQDGSDRKGRRTSTPTACKCPYIGSSRSRNCTCLKEEDIYHSPLKDLHFKRLITDEGHIFGNASKSSITEASTVVQFLRVTSRWIVSGTPTQGLYGTETSIAASENSSISTSPLRENDGNKQIGSSDKARAKQLLNSPTFDDLLQISIEQSRDIYKQERKDLEKLGNIATMYLKVRPWANTADDSEAAQWSRYVMQPRHGSKSHGNIHCLRSTLEGMIVRNRPEDVENDVILPALHQSIVTLDGSLQDKMSLNIFSMLIVSNAITSERKDADYFFHRRQRAALDLLVKNLRQASFHWSGFSLEDIKNATQIAKDFLEKGEVPVSLKDRVLLQEAIQVGESVLANSIKKATSMYHEMPMYIQNEWPEEVRAAWSLDGETKNPTLMGATMVHSLQKIVRTQLWKPDPMDGLEQAGRVALRDTYLKANPERTTRQLQSTSRNRASKVVKKADQSSAVLAGGIIAATVNEPSPMKRTQRFSSSRWKSSNSKAMAAFELSSASDSMEKIHPARNGQIIDGSKIPPDTKLKSAMKISPAGNKVLDLDPTSPLASTMLVSTSSAKLTYLMQRITEQHETEKILVFYEADNVAYYIAQALECLNIKHLIYAKSLPSNRKSQYAVTFNRTETFRVLLMDISQAAFGLDMSSASRVYFVNPVFSPQVEAQAVKRAHRIGQTKPVFVETLVLKGGIEEIILERRKDMTTEEHKKCKNILNDRKIYNWIRNVQFIPLPGDNGPGPDQMALLDKPERVFGRGTGSNVHEAYNPDSDLIMSLGSLSSKGKRKASVAFQSDSNTSGTSVTTSAKRKAVAFRWGNSPSPTEDLDETQINNPELRRVIEDGLEEGDKSYLYSNEHSDLFERFNKAPGSQSTTTYRGLFDATTPDTCLSSSGTLTSSLANNTEHSGVGEAIRY